MPTAIPGHERREIRPLPIDVPAAAPVEVGAAAHAMVFAIEALAFGATDDLARADALVTHYRDTLAQHGWRLDGPRDAKRYTVVPS